MLWVLAPFNVIYSIRLIVVPVQNTKFSYQYTRKNAACFCLLTGLNMVELASLNMVELASVNMVKLASLNMVELASLNMVVDRLEHS